MLSTGARTGSVPACPHRCGWSGTQASRLRLRAGPPHGPGAPRPDRPAVRARSGSSTRRRRGRAPRRRRRRGARDGPRPPTTSPRCGPPRPTPTAADPASRARAPRTTRPSPACTRPAPGSSRAPGELCAERVGGRAPSTGSTSAAACTTPCPATPPGFCIYNDIAVGIQWLLDHGAERVAYVDIDVHHGDGVERIFWDDPRVLTISVHETRARAVPRHRLGRRHRRPAARGTAVNVALPPGTGDSAWLRAIALVGRAARARLQARRARHPARLRHPRRRTRSPTSPITVDAQRRPPRRCTGLAHEVCRRPLGRARRRRLRAGRRRAAVVDPPDRDRRAPCRWRRPTPVPQELARPRAARLSGGPAPRRMGDLDPAEAADLVAAVGHGLQPGQRGRPGHHGDPAGGLPPPRPRRLVRLTAMPAPARRDPDFRPPSGVSTGQRGPVSPLASP